MQPQDPTLLTRASDWARNSVTLKLLSIGILLLLLLIPSSMVESLITERASNRDAATEEISAQWGGAQLVLGPVLVLPYTAVETLGTDNKRTTEVTRYLCLLPDTLNSTGTLEPERRHRGIYEAVVYRAKMRVQGVFQAPALAAPGWGDIADWWAATTAQAAAGRPAAEELARRYGFLADLLPDGPVDAVRRAEATFALASDL